MNINIIDRYLSLIKIKDEKYREKKIRSLLMGQKEQYIIKLLKEGACAYNEGQSQEALNYFILANELSGYESQHLLGEIYILGEKIGDFTETLNALFKFAYQAFRNQRYAIAMEAYHIGFTEMFGRSYDSQGLYKDVEKEAEEVYRKVIDIYKKKIDIAPRKFVKKKGKLNLVHIVGNLIDDTHSPSKIVKNFIKYHNYEKFNLFVFSSEVFVKRDTPYFLIEEVLPNSYIRAPKLINYLKERNVKFFATPVSGSHIDSAITLAKELVANDIDIALFHSSRAFTIDCIVAGMELIPLQINFCHGGEISSGGIDAIFYYVKSSYEKSKDYWKSRNVKTIQLDISYDCDEELKSSIPDRRRFNISKEAKILVTVSNHLEKRLTSEFLEVLIRILKENEQTYYLAIGGGDLTRQKNILKENGLLDRVIFTGPRRNAVSLIKMSDIYLNEFPMGSGCAVLEAMACEKPVVAMHYSDEHTHCIGANYVGKDLAIKSKDYQSYIEFANRLIRDEEYYKDISKKIRKRYEDEYSPSRVVNDYEDIILKLYQEKFM